jgi:UDP-N-acetylglucosamine 2-epimerase
VMPMHPRTRQRVELLGINPGRNIHVTSPAGYVEMLRLQRWACCVVTDSGGMQKEAYALGTPCVTLRSETEWVETVDAGWNRLSDLEPAEIVRAVEQMNSPVVRALPRPELYGDGHAADRISAALTSPAS